MQMLHDEVFVTAFARTPGKVHVTSGSNTVFTQDVPVGVTMMRVPMAPGEQDFHFTTDAGTNVKGRSVQTVRSSCTVRNEKGMEGVCADLTLQSLQNGIYNYNFISGLLTGV